MGVAGYRMSLELIVWFNSPDNGNPEKSITGGQRIVAVKQSADWNIIRGTKISDCTGDQDLIRKE